MTQPTLTIPEHQMSDFLSQHRLPQSYRTTADRHFLPLVERFPAMRANSAPLILGINGAQGTGKSTLADFLRLAATSMFEWNVAVLSVDDFYYTRAERKMLSAAIHPLLFTRGVPGTHDTDMLAACLGKLKNAGDSDNIALPRFDKATDDRADESRWPVVSGPLDLVILEGWCVGTIAQSDASLEQPVNALERNEDSDGVWRHYVNHQLGTRYAQLFAQIDQLIFLRAPSFDAILRWRLEQEEKLADSLPARSSGLMNEDQIRRFIQYYERLTRVNLATLPDSADIVFELDEAHAVSC